MITQQTIPVMSLEQCPITVKIRRTLLCSLSLNIRKLNVDNFTNIIFYYLIQLRERKKQRLLTENFQLPFTTEQLGYRGLGLDYLEIEN